MLPVVHSASRVACSASPSFCSARSATCRPGIQRYTPTTVSPSYPLYVAEPLTARSTAALAPAERMYVLGMV